MSIQNNKLMNLADGKVLYDDLRERIEAAEGDLEDLIAVQDETPTNPVTEIWMTETPPAGIQVPTYAEHQALSNCIAPYYEDLTFPVAAGQHCIQNGKYYVTENGIQTSEEWTPTHWLEVPNVGEEVEALDKAVIISDTQPTTADNKLWINNEETEEFTIPTYGEYQALSSALNQKYEKPGGGIPGSDLADSYIEEPSAEGTSGQVLTTDGNGGRSWTTVSGGGGDLPQDFPTEETAQDLLEYETYNAGLTDTTLAVIGMLFDNLPQNEAATDILHSLELECDRLNTIYNGWIAERESA